jgi:hypothetical protein
MQKRIHEEHSMRKIMRPTLALTLLLALCLCALRGSAQSISCPAALTVTPNILLQPNANGGLTSAAIVNNGNDIVCSYEVKLLMPRYSSRVLSAQTKAACDQAGNNANPSTCAVCPAFSLNAAIPASPPPTPINTWAFGPPGTSATHTFAPLFMKIVTNASSGSSDSQKSPGAPGEKVTSMCETLPVNVVFAIHSSVPAGYSCSASGTTVTCWPPLLCPGNIYGVNITETWPAAAPAGSFTYYPGNSRIYKYENGAYTVDVQSPSLNTLASDTGVGWTNTNPNSNYLIIRNTGCETGGGTPGESNSFMPAGVAFCIYNTFPFMNGKSYPNGSPAQNGESYAVITIASNGGCPTPP